MDNPIENIGKNEKLLRASKDFQKLGEGKKRRRLLKEAQRKDGTYLAPMSPKEIEQERIKKSRKYKEYERIREEERIREKEIRERLNELEKLPDFERPEGMSDEEYTRELVKYQAETDGIKKGKRLTNKDFSNAHIPTTDVQKLYTEGRNLNYKPLTKKAPEVKRGPRGGRYTEDKTKDGRPYRRYF